MHIKLDLKRRTHLFKKTKRTQTTNLIKRDIHSNVVHNTFNNLDLCMIQGTMRMTQKNEKQYDVTYHKT
jgi:hypothetical protein